MGNPTLLSAGAGAACLWSWGCGAFLVLATDCQEGFTRQGTVPGVGIAEECTLAGAVYQYHWGVGCIQDWGDGNPPRIVSMEMHCGASALAGSG